MSNKHTWWAWAVKNSICIICWTILAAKFDRWWIALFAMLFMSSLETTKNKGDHHYFICDCCGRYSPEGTSRDDAERRRIEAGWIRRKINDKWKDICPECQNTGNGTVKEMMHLSNGGLTET